MAVRKESRMQVEGSVPGTWGSFGNDGDSEAIFRDTICMDVSVERTCSGTRREERKTARSGNWNWESMRFFVSQK